MTLLAGYDLRKAAQVVAFFAMKEGGAINVLKVSKLLYLAEREHMAKYDEPMFYDKLVSMPDGPVASVTLNFINGSNTDISWSEFVAARSGFDIPLARQDMTIDDLGDLSRADLEILGNLWSRFGNLNQWQIRDWTHEPENVPEWQDPLGSSLPISSLKIFKAMNKADYASLAKDISEYRALEKAINECGSS